MRSASLRAASFIGGIAALVGSLVLPACSASPNSEITAEQGAAVTTTYKGLIKSQGGLCLDVFANEQQSGAAVDIATCNGTNAQTFAFTVGGPGPIMNVASGMCLDDVWGGGAALEMVTCSGTPEQQWMVWGTFPTSTQIMDDAYGHCLDVLGDQQRNGQTADPATCNGTGAQVWSFEPLPPTCGDLGKNACGGSTPTNYTCNPGLVPRGTVPGTGAASVICCPSGDSNLGSLCCPSGSVNSKGQCTACGASGEPACTGGACSGGFTSVNGTCEPCGANGQRACGSTCDSGLVSVSGTCKPCGAQNGICCANSTCGGSLVCVGAVTAGGKCVPPSQVGGSGSGGSSSGGSTCGGANGPCPCKSDGTCSSGYVCVGGTTCYECGETGGICCNVDKYNSKQCSQASSSCTDGYCYQ